MVLVDWALLLRIVDSNQEEQDSERVTLSVVLGDFNLRPRVMGKMSPSCPTFIRC